MPKATQGDIALSQIAGERLDPLLMRKLATDVDALAKDVSKRAPELMRNPAELSKVIERERDIAGQIPAAAVPLRAGIADTVGVLAEVGVAQAQQLRGRAGLPTPEDFIKALQTKYSNAGSSRASVDFAALGSALGSLFYDTPTFRPYLGSMTLPLKVAKARAAKSAIAKPKDEFVSEKPQHLEEADAAAAEEANNAKRAQQIFIDLKKYMTSEDAELARDITCKDGKVRTMVPMIEALFNPWSYSQTVENLFYFSFLVKQQLAGIHFPVGDLTPPFITLKGIGKSPEEDARVAAKAASAGGLQFQAKQFVLQLDPDSFAKICKHANLKQPLMPHRQSKDSTAPKEFEYQNGADAKTVSGKKRTNRPADAETEGKRESKVARR